MLAFRLSLHGARAVRHDHVARQEAGLVSTVDLLHVLLVVNRARRLGRLPPVPQNDFLTRIQIQFWAVAGLCCLARAIRYALCTFVLRR